MDKKNTMLLTVIAVATLLVAVVGATFAFFTATDTAGGETTVQTTTEVVGAVAISSEKSALHIRLEASEMTQEYAGQTGKSFWATAGDGRWVAEKEDANVSVVNVTGGTEDTVYTCKYTLTVTKPTEIKAGDMALVLTLDGATIDNVTSGSEIDLAGVNAPYEVNFNVKGNVEDKVLVKAAVKFTNKAEAQQHLLEKTLDVKLENSNITCTVGK